jgi:hypothetical protein
VSRHEVPLNGHKFYIRRMDPFTALGVLADLQKSVLSPILNGADGKGISATDKAATTESLLAGLGKLSEKLGREETLRIVRMLLDPEFVSVIIDGTSEPVKLRDQQVMQTMSGAADMLTLSVEVVKVNYSDFLAPLTPLISSARSLLEDQQGVSPKG